MLRKYWVELVCLILLLAIGGSIAYHCTHKPTSTGKASATATVEPAAAVDWTLIIQVASGIVVALIGVSPALIRAFKSGKAEEIADEVEKDIKVVVQKVSPLLTPEQLEQVRKMIEQGSTLPDAYDTVKKEAEKKSE